MTLLGVETGELGSGTAGARARAAGAPLWPRLVTRGPGAAPAFPLHVTHAPIVASPSDIPPPASPGDDSPGRGRWIRA